MPSKTNTDLVRELLTETALLRNRQDSTAQQLVELQLLRARHAELSTRLAVTDTHVSELKKQLEESDRRRWQLMLVLLAAGLGLFANLILAILNLRK